MTRDKGRGPSGVDHTSLAPRHDRAPRPSPSRRGLWLFSLIVAAGSIMTVIINGAGSASTQVPSVIQVGRHSTTTPTVVTTTNPTSNTATSSTTIPVAQRLTTVVHPQANVTEHQDSNSGDNANEATATNTSAGNP